jgi:hypothetical protein
MGVSKVGSVGEGEGFSCPGSWAMKTVKNQDLTYFLVWLVLNFGSSFKFHRSLFAFGTASSIARIS